MTHQTERKGAHTVSTKPTDILHAVRELAQTDAQRLLDDLLQDAFSLLHHDGGPQDKEYVWLRSKLRDSFAASLAKHRRALADRAEAESQREEACFCDRTYPDSNPDASCGDCPKRDYPQREGQQGQWMPIESAPKDATQSTGAAHMTLIDELARALRGVIAVADRKTVEFDAARSALAKYETGEITPTPTREEFCRIIAEALQFQWDDWCMDTGCFPGDITLHNGKKNTMLEFKASQWVRYAAERAYAQVVSRRAATKAEGAANVPHTNTGHGHVWQRPDGVKARCGGPGLCTVCSRDYAQFFKAPEAKAEGAQAPVAWREMNGGEWVYYDADSEVGEHIALYQKFRHGTSVFPLYTAPQSLPDSAQPDQVQAVAWIHRVKSTGFVRGIYQTVTPLQREIAELEGDEYVPLYPAPHAAPSDGAMAQAVREARTRFFDAKMYCDWIEHRAREIAEGK